MKHMTIEWKEINPDYIVSSDGQVGSRMSGGLKMLHPKRDGHGYLQVGISVGGCRKAHLVHKLVLEMFVGNKPTPAHQANHKNGVKTDNRVENLEWVTRSQNVRHRFDVLKIGNARGEANGLAKLTETDVLEILSRVASGQKSRAVARDYGVNESTVRNIVHGKTWSWFVAGDVRRDVAIRKAEEVLG